MSKADFELDPVLEKDCIIIGELDDCLLLLMNNSLVPWFIFVPMVEATELFELSDEHHRSMSKNINQLSQFILNKFNSTKINIAAIGNVVNQLHIHVIGRHPNDYCWPNVVWGRPEKEEYYEEKAEIILQSVRSQFGQIR